MMIAAVKETLSHAPLVCAAIAAFSLAALAAALTAQYAYGMEPCTLCLYQRVPYALTAILGLAGFFAAWKFGRPKAAALLLFISSVVFLIGATIALYHAGVEQRWWISFLEGCKVTFDTGETKSLLEKIQTLSAVPCDQPAWEDPFFGLSMAAWNVIISAGAAFDCLIASILIARKANGVL
ncbi:MAG: disulfide bond formation protein B [Proteobacteria bacterium]|nr:disulfide bond formation protein B [Pseudomonadota bacterium]